MSINDDQTMEMFRPTIRTPVDGRDLENLVSLMELAAIELSMFPTSTFTADELFEMAVYYGGPTIALRRVDFDIVRDQASFLEPMADGKWRLR